ncbi:hypothetical protein [Paenibacillus alvei]|uniref:hypothetical protein n=1 Tax=Paenibacillus alvei TaxID=44250 RepID=UPI0022801A5D|nr:hypothetical protein [Paenibacillus alvei]
MSEQEHMDVQIIKLLNEEQGETESGKGSVLKGYVKTSSEIIRFEQRYLLDKKVAIHLPKAFEIMPSDLAALKYPSERRPSLILMSESTTINIAFNHTNTPIEEQDVGAFKDAMMEFIKQTQPSAQWYENDVLQINDKSVSYFDLLIPALDTSIYNLMFCTELEGRALMCTFNCTEQEMNDWKPIAFEVMHTLRTMTREGGASL